MKPKIFLSGGMSAFANDDQQARQWRTEVTEALKDDFTILSPTDCFWFVENDEQNEREAFNWDLTMVRNADLVIVNFNDPKSIGTAIEIGIASEHKIPIIGLNQGNNDIHIWYKFLCSHISTNMYDMINHVKFYYGGRL